MKNIVILLLLLLSLPSFAQVKGKITSKTGEAVPFAAITVSGTYNGTSSNDEGLYTLHITKSGSYTFTFRSLGYKTREVTVAVEKFPHTLNVTLEEERYTLQEVVISGENPADAIIKKAIAGREANAAKTAAFEADFYSRGVFRVKEVPEEILGQEVGDLGGSLGADRSGILYLSETVSRVKYRNGEMHERIIASKVSGEDNGYSYNNAASAEFDFYNNYLPFEVNVVSPIADNAFDYYDYSIESTFYDKEKHLINKIKVTPKREKEPAMTGYIYIVEDSWELYATDLSIKGSQIRQPLLNTMSVRQNFNYHPKEKVWARNSQVLTFDISLLGVGASGRFSHVYSNFNFNPGFDEKSFTNEVLYFEKDANDKDNRYWNRVRPIPLTEEEISDYRKKERLEQAESTKAYKDSTDRLRNRITIPSAALGYTYYNSHENWTVSYSGIIRRLGFNTVQAYNLAPSFYFTKTNPASETYTTVGTDLNYGFAEKRFRATGTISRKYNNFTDATITLSGGSSIEQFNPEQPINRIVNSISTLFFRENYMKLYDNNFLRLSYEEEVLNGLRLYGSFEYTRRRGLFNNTNFSTLKDLYKPYTSNNPLLPFDYDTPAFVQHNMLKASLQARIRFGQKYRTLPNDRELLPNVLYPDIYLKYEKGFAASIDDYNFDHLSARVTYDITLGNKGELGTSFRAGKFFNNKDIAFPDFRHFNGNQTHIGKSQRYLNVFNLLPYYTHSTSDAYFEAHLEHNFKGYFLNKVPLISELNYHLVAGYHLLTVPTQKPYMEFTVGLDNLGWGKARFLRIDYVRSYESGFRSGGVIFGLTFLDFLE